MRIDAAKRLENLQSQKTPSETALNTARERYDKALAEERAVFGEWAADKDVAKGQLTAFDAIAADVRRMKDVVVGCATLSNFRLMRTSSAQMANFSHFRPEKPATSRMGLKLWAPTGANSDDGVSEYIVGGWCIGTVLDARSSRVTTMTPNIGVNHDIRPKNVALNVQVNVQWCSGDELYKNYMDASGMVQKRGDKKRTGATLDAADEDVVRAALASGGPAPAAADSNTAPVAGADANPNMTNLNDFQASAAGATVLGGGGGAMRVGGASRRDRAAQ